MRADPRGPRPQGGAPDARRGARPCGCASTGPPSTPPVPTFLGARTILDQPLEELVERIDWSPFFTTWELAGQYPRILSDPTVGSAATDLFRDAQRLLERIVARPAAARQRGGRLLASGVHTRRRHRGVCGRGPLDGPDPAPHPAPADGQDQRPPGRGARGLHGARRLGCRRPRGPVRGDRGHRPRGAAGAVHGRQRRLRLDHGRGPRRPARGGVRGAAPRAGPARAVGIRPGRGRSTTTHSSPSDTRASGRRRATPRAPTTPRSGPSSSCWTPSGRPASRSRNRWRCCRARRSAATTSGTRRRATSVSAASTVDQLADYARRKGWSVDEAERWLAPNLMGGILG